MNLPNTPQGNEKSIKSVLEELVSQNGAELLADRLSHPSIDQALKEIQIILDGAKPIGINIQIPDVYRSIAEYQSNIKEVIGL